MSRVRYVDLSGAPRSASAPPPPPQRAVAADPPVPRRTLDLDWHVIIIVFLVAANIGQFLLRRSAPAPTPAPGPTSGVALGKAFRGPLCDSLAEGYDLMATQVAAGVSITEADKALKEKFHAARARAFDTQCADAFVAIVPEGEPKTQAQRDAWVALSKDFATGLRYRGK